MKATIDTEKAPFGNWVSGKVGVLAFDAKVFRDPSRYGINKGRVSVLSIYVPGEGDFFIRERISFDDGKWLIKVTPEYREYYDAVMEALDEYATKCLTSTETVTTPVEVIVSEGITVNQVMILLDKHRGTETQKVIGTYDEDIQKLINYKLLGKDGTNLTTRGRRYVNAIKNPNTFSFQQLLDAMKYASSFTSSMRGINNYADALVEGRISEHNLITPKEEQK